MQAGAHAVRDAIPKRFLAGGGAGVFFLAGFLEPGDFLSALAGRGIRKIRGDDGGLLLVIAAVQDVADGVPHPF